VLEKPRLGSSENRLKYGKANRSEKNTLIRQCKFYNSAEQSPISAFGFLLRHHAKIRFNAASAWRNGKYFFNLISCRKPIFDDGRRRTVE
jgi:hypothetical protein